MEPLELKRLLEKYDVPAPRYTSYPTVPYWSDIPSTKEWFDSINKTLDESKSSWSMYIHIPFCETLCTFCGCNTTITKDHKREPGYLERLLTEWSIYLKECPELKNKPLKEVHLGGGTPTFFSPDHLKELIERLQDNMTLSEDFEGSIEVDPRRTKVEHLQKLYDLGFRRVSMGVQDFDPEVQRLVNRVQSEEITRDLTTAAREMGYTSVNYDLIYGLPKQNLDTMKVLIEKTIEHRPDRIAFYSFALVPWIKPTHRIFKDEDLPVGSKKRELYEYGREELLRAGYVEIGMDHFALPEDSLALSLQEKRLHRNFMGYTAHRTDLLLGLGVSSISESPEIFHQNEKKLPVYERSIDEEKIPTLRGHKLTTEDKVYRELILKLMTEWEVELSTEQAYDLQDFLSSMKEDALIEFSDQTIRVTESGRPFIRNICMGLDMRLRQNQPDRKVFSQSI
jgi:oxygen-independent coproporphyrinogen-3 oxidase